MSEHDCRKILLIEIAATRHLLFPPDESDMLLICTHLEAKQYAGFGSPSMRGFYIVADKCGLRIRTAHSTCPLHDKIGHYCDAYLLCAYP